MNTSTEHARTDEAASTEEAGTDAVRPTVTVRYWASVRAAAGRPADEVRAFTVAEALATVCDLHADSARFVDVVKICSVLVGSAPVGTRDHASVALNDGAVVELLPPFAGG